MRDYEVIICGAGVGGLALAVALGRQGRRVLVLEKQQADVRVHRGELLQPRTLEILDAWGILPTLRERGALNIVAMEARSARGSFLGELNYQLLTRAFNSGLVHYYAEIKSALHAHVPTTVDVCYGTRVIDLLRDATGEVVGVTVTRGTQTETITGELVVAADGRLSPIRKLLGIEVAMFQYPHQLLGFDLADVSALQPRMCAFLTGEGVRVLYPMPHGRARLYVQIKRGEFTRIKQQGATFWEERLLAKTPGLSVIRPYLPESFASAQIQGAWSYNSPVWSRDGVALLGDAAHAVHPAAGQGMNAAIIDAWSLAHWLELCSDGACLTPSITQRALSCYDQRRQEFAFVGSLCHKMALLCTADTLAKRVLTTWGLRANQKNYRLQYLLMSNVAGYSARRFPLLDRLRRYGLLPDSRTALLGS